MGFLSSTVFLMIFTMFGGFIIFIMIGGFILTEFRTDYFGGYFSMTDYKYRE